MRAVGESLQRVDAIKKVTGQAQYVDDIIMPRMLYAQVKRSPYPHARILRIDTSKAEALPGVRSVITGDCYTKRCGLYLEDKNFLAVGTAKYRGEAVAAVAAETPEIADEAVELIEVEYEQLPAVTNAVEGMKPDVILEALRRAGVTFLDEETAPQAEKTPITKADLMEWGLAGGEGSSQRRQALLRRLDLPEHLTANGMLEALNLLVSREKLEELLADDR